MDEGRDRSLVNHPMGGSHVAEREGLPHDRLTYVHRDEDRDAGANAVLGERGGGGDRNTLLNGHTSAAVLVRGGIL